MRDLQQLCHQWTQLNSNAGATTRRGNFHTVLATKPLLRAISPDIAPESGIVDENIQPETG